MAAQTGQGDNHLVILSIPFQRLIRSHLSPMVLEILTKRADVVIVSPFAEHPDFVKQYKGERISHTIAYKQEELPWLFRKLTAISSILRTRGYWYRNRKHLLYYWATRHICFGENGNDTVASLPQRVVMDILAWIGSWPQAWVLLDSLIGRRSYHMPELTSLALPYDHVTLIQTASWGFQDQTLAWIGRKQQWRTVLLPYTTDQLFANGYLYSDFDAVCVQGTAERQFALILHGINDSKIVNLGSLSFFSMRQVLINKPAESAKVGGLRRILFAGSNATYFPTESEFECLEHLLESVENGELENTAITYRPLGHTREIRAIIERRFSDHPHLEIKYASPTIFGLDKYTSTEWLNSLSEHLESIEGFDMAITVIFTSMALDLTIFDTPTIAYFYDATGIMKKRKTELLFTHDGTIRLFEEMPSVFSKKKLVPTINRLLNDPAERARIVRETSEAWDYKPPNILKLLETAVFGEDVNTQRKGPISRNDAKGKNKTTNITR